MKKFWFMKMFVIILQNISEKSESSERAGQKISGLRTGTSVPEFDNEIDLIAKEIMRNLVRRYVTQEQRKAENEGVTEDDVNEIKNDISAFRFEMIEIMRASGMNTRSASGPSGNLV